MKQTPSTSSHRSLALILALLAPSLSAAQSVSLSAAATGSAATAGSAAASARAATAVAPLSIPLLPSSLSLTPSLSLMPSVSVAPLAVMAAPSAAAAHISAVAAPVSAFVAPQAALGALTESVRVDAKAAPASAPVAPTSFLFDGASARRAIDDAAPVAASALLGGPAALERPTADIAVKPAETLPLPARTAPARGRSLLGKALLAAALLFAFPAVALAATAAAPALAGAASLAFLASIHPLVSAVAAAAGAVYGLIAARHKDGTPVSTSEALTSMLRYGMLAGAGVYVLLDLTQLIFLGVSAVALTPLSSAVATAALGQSAFQGTFKDAATSPADRIMSAFPAVAAALGLSVGIVMTLAVPTTLFATALAASVAFMSVTGVAAALYSALYTPGKSPENGPARMARGYVLQALMTGMALALSNPYFVVPFLLLGAWGFSDVLMTTVREFVSRLPLK